jgi:sulfate adenylyltransferase subunit 1
VTGIWLGEKQKEQAVAGESVCITIQDDIDISRGDVIASHSGVQPSMANDFVLDVCWLRTTPLVCGTRYTIRHATQEVAGIVKEIEYKLDIDKQEKVYGVEQLTANDIARIRLKTAAPLVFDPYKDNRTMGSLIFIDATNDTVGAGMIVESND